MGANRQSGDRLSAYRAKRSLDRTPEPGARPAPRPAAPGSAARGGLFVVHMHAARRLHWDLRLELDGVLASWAVPKGPSPDRADKRLAVRVEDHPLEYGDFEGVIPQGNYGAGAVIVWDRGRWAPVEDPHEGLRRGKLLFDLYGYKLRGRWTLVKLAKGDKDWLLIKERDAYVAPASGLPPQSVLSGLTVEELSAGLDRAGPVVRTLERLRAPRRAVSLAAAAPMLAAARERPFSKPGWVFEPKLDGYRIRAGREGGAPRLLTRNGHDLAAAFPEVARAVAALPYEGFVLDGELVVPDAAGRPSFERLQDRAGLRRTLEVRRAALESPAVLYVFDLLAFAGYDLRPLPLLRRKALLERLVPPLGPIRYLEHVATDGAALYERVVALGLEGIVAKKADAPYRAGRSPHWLKVRADRTAEFVVVGFTRPRGARGARGAGGAGGAQGAPGARAGFGALDLGAYTNGTLVYAGRVGTGFTAAQLAAVRSRLERSVRPTPAVAGPVPRDPGHTWVDPVLVAEIRYKERTAGGLLRHPVFLRFRDDKRPQDCELEWRGAPPAAAPAPAPAPGPVPLRSAPRSVELSNLDKVFWPDEGYTKGDLIAYYRAISPWLLPYLADRPVVLTRFPDGIAGKSFFQKDAPPYVPAWLRTERMWSEETQREIDYFVCDDLASLLYLINLGTIPLHVWGSRVATLERPDWCILDLDPKDAPFAHVVAVARAAKRLCDAIGLPCFVKTSGSTGLHLLLPLGRQCTFEQARALGGLLARVIAAELPAIATVARQVGKRGARVYLDYVQNGHGRLLVAPFSARPLPGAPVSMPLAWKEVTPRLDIRRFTIETAPGRMRRLGADPLRPVLDLRPDLVRILGQLEARLA
jgi:bifunctional non-homologous end joining protein LigD